MPLSPVRTALEFYGSGYKVLRFTHYIHDVRR